MAIVPKTKTIQLRVEPELFDKFSARADIKDTTVSAIIRGLMIDWIRHVEHRERKDAEWAATLESRRNAVLDQAASQKPAAVAPVASTLSDRRKAEKLAKEAKRLKRDQRFSRD
jgi:anti-sigma-K factor RskA